MNLQDTISQVESHGFAVQLGVASDWRTFRRALREHPVANRLNELLATTANQAAVLRRVQSLSQRETDARYENPWDVALTVYVDALHRHDQVLARLAASAARRAGHIWWISRVVDRVLTSAEAPHHHSFGAGDRVSMVTRPVATVASGPETVQDALYWPDMLRLAPVTALLSHPSRRASSSGQTPSNRPATSLWLRMTQASNRAEYAT